MKKIYKVLLTSLFLVLGIITSLNFSYKDTVFAQQKAVSVDKIYYVALGDSITDGYGLEGYNEDASYTGEIARPDGSFFALFDNKLKDVYGNLNVDSVCYAHQGDKSENLLNLITSNSLVQEKLQQADIVTITIGANDILQFFTSEANINITELQKALTTFSSNLDLIVSQLKNICNGKIIFNLTYNPFLSIMQLSDFNVYYQDILTSQVEIYNKNKLKEIYVDLTNAYVCNITSADIESINYLTIKKINQLKNEKINNFYYFDVYSVFSDLINSNEKLTSYVNANFDIFEQTISSQEKPLTQLQFLQLFFSINLDPHPSKDGHELIANKLEDFFNNNFAILKKDFNGGTYNNLSCKYEILNKNDYVNIHTYIPSLQGNTFLEWTTSTGQKFESIAITQFTTIYAKWKETINITFDFNGGIYDGQNSIIVQVFDKLQHPSFSNDIKKDKHKLVGWTIDTNTNVLFDFEKDSLQASSTLYAVWEKIVIEITLDFNGGKFESLSEKTITINKIDTEFETLNLSNISPKKDGFRFTGFYKDANLTEKFDISIKLKEQDDGLLLYAGWVQQVKITLITPNQSPQNIDCDINTNLNDLQYKNIKNAYLFGFYYDQNLTQEVPNDYVLEKNEQFYAKWAIMSLTGKAKQEFSPIVEQVKFEVQAKENAEVYFKVNNEKIESSTQTVDESGIATFNFSPKSAKKYTISSVITIDNQQHEIVFSETLDYSYSTPVYMKINKVNINGNTISLKMENYSFDNNQDSAYFDKTKFYWVKTQDNSSEEFLEVFAKNLFEIDYKFTSDCKVKLVYMDSIDGEILMESNIIDIKISNKVDIQLVIGLSVIGVLLIVSIVAFVIIRNKYKSYY